MSEPEAPRKLYQALPEELRREAPLSVLLCNRMPFSFSEYPLPFLLALELPAEAEDRFAHYSAGRASS